ncbi:MAG: phage holin family protein [Roseiflexaceae bacterium]|nr:phage holin family protein [Roseiflexaceae bacterium]
MRLLIRWVISALALLAAANFVDGIEIVGQNGWITLLITAAVMGFVNAIIRPILKLLSCPLILLTLGPFTLVINALMLQLSAWLSNSFFGAGFVVDGFWPAFWGAIVVSIVSWLLSVFVPDADEKLRERNA